jgi:hypothetical protein
MYNDTLLNLLQHNIGLTFSFNILILYCVLCYLSSSCILCNHSCLFLGIVHFLLSLRYSLTLNFNKFSHNDKGQTFFISGALFANIYLLEAVCRLGGSTLFNNIYHKTRPLFKGMVFFVMAGFPLFASLLLM